MIIDKNLIRILSKRRFQQISSHNSFSTSLICTSSYRNNNQLILSNVKLGGPIQTIQRTVKHGASYTNLAQGRNKGPEIKKFTKFYIVWLMFLFCVVIFVDFQKILLGTRETDKEKRDQDFYLNTGLPRTDAASKDESENKEEEVKVEKKKKNKKAKHDEKASGSESESDDTENNKEDKSDKKKKKHVTFRDRKIIEYENRIREYSTPDKIFRYFATLKVWNEATNDYEIFMRPEDFVRSLTYGDKQPDGLGLDSYQRYEPNMYNLEMELPEDSVFYHLGQRGLISFSDYLFLLTLLSIPTRHFEISFKMWDLDGSGNIDIQEFEELQTVIRNNTNVGNKHRDTRMTGSVLKENSALNKYFFGEDFKGLLTVEKFIHFQKQLQSEIIKMEFQRCNPVDGKIKDVDFCMALLAYAGFNDTKTKRMLKRITKAFKDDIVRAKGISFKDYENFFHVLRSIQDIDTALKFYSLAGASIDQAIFKHVAKTVSGVELADHLVQVVFMLFDDNGDGKLSHHEFISVMKKRWLRGLQNPKDTGFVKLMSAFYECGKETTLSRII